MILIVDDKPENIFSLRSLLELYKFEVDTAASGAEALKKILKNSYSLIILDVQMPEMDGFEVAEAISGYSKSRDIPIIFLSAVNTHKKFVTRGYESGGIDYVTKPFDPDLLILKVKTFYRLSEQNQRLNALEKELRHEIELRKQAESVLESKVEERTRELYKANQRLTETNRDLQQFAYVASHDLQEPLRKIQTFSNLVLERHLDQVEKVKTYMEKIGRSASRLRSLVNDLLDYSRTNDAIRFSRVNLRKVVQDVLADLDLQSQQYSCKVIVSELAEIDADSLQMYQVFQNLLSNALKFSGTKPNCEIVISGEFVIEKRINARSSPSGEFYRLSIRDNGIGFNNEFNERIFEIFQRLNDRHLFEGTGIGLAIVKKIIERHDGLISANGKPGEGATFTFVLPVHHQIPVPQSNKSYEKQL